MNYEIKCLPEIALIGKEGFCTAGNHLAPGLWEQANAHFTEVAHLGMKERDGSLVGFWGAMSDEGRRFLPWEQNYTRGWYLAGLEVYPDTPVPEGWVKWILPARTYLVVPVTMDRYHEIFADVLEHLLPEVGYTLSGAVCDHTKPSTGESFLFFPVETHC